MSLTRAQLRGLVEARTGRTDKTTVCNTLLDLAQVYVAQQALAQGLRIVGTKHEATLTPGAGAESVALPAGCCNLIHVEFVDPANTASAWTVPIKSKTWVRERVPNIDALSSNRPTVCYRDGSNLYLVPTCDVGTYNLVVTYTSEPTAFASDSAVSELQGFDECLAARATAELFRSVEKFQEAAQWDGQFAQLFLAAVAHARKDGVEYNFEQFDSGSQTSPTPWFDPFAQNSR